YLLLCLLLFSSLFHRPLLHPHSFPTRRSSDLSKLLERKLQLDVMGGYHYEGYVVQPDDAGRNIPAVRDTRLMSLADFETGLTPRSEEHTSELQSPYDLVCRLLLEKKKTKPTYL